MPFITNQQDGSKAGRKGPRPPPTVVYLHCLSQMKFLVSVTEHLG